MLIAISTDGQRVAEHFGRCPSYTIVEIENGKTVEKQVVDNPGHSPGNIPKFLKEKGVEQIVCGGMGMRAKGFFDEMGIETIMGIDEEIDDVIKKLEAGNIQGGRSMCAPGDGKGYGIEKTECDHSDE